MAADIVRKTIDALADPKAAADPVTGGNDVVGQRLSDLSPQKRALLQRKLLEKRAASNALTIGRRSVTGPCPLSFAQELMWLLDQLNPGGSAYNVPRALEIHGPLNIDALQRALSTIVARHEIMRTTYEVVDGRPRQVIASQVEVTLPLTDLSGLPEAERAAEANRIIIQLSDRGFNLARDQLLRTALLRLASEKHVLILVSHHIASDGWSKGVLFRELEALYPAYCQGLPSPLPELPLQYADFAIWQRQWYQGDAVKKLLDYWKQNLAGAPALLELPTDYPRPQAQSNLGKRMATQFPQSLAEGLKELSRQEGATLFMTGLAAFAILMHRYSGQDDVVIGTPISGRTRTELEKTIGYFSNSLALRADLKGDPSFRVLLGRIRKTCLDAYSHQEMPFEKLIVELNPERTLSYTPVYQVMFAVGHADMEELKLPGLKVISLFSDRDTAKFDLSMGMRDVGTGLLAGIEGSTDIFTTATMERMLGHLRTLLEAIVANPDERVSRFPLVTAEERRQILLDWAGPRRDFPLHICLHQLFEAQVERTPNAVAVELGNQRLTYRELNAQANQLARLLRQAGVGRGDFVAILQERGPHFLLAMLAIFKAGGAYIPIDPNYPRDRVQYLLTKSESRTILSHGKLLGKFGDMLAGCDCLQAVICLENLPGDSLATARKPELTFYDRTAFVSLSGENLENVNQASDPLYMIFTSGSTGLPKGAVIRHNGAVNHIFAQFDALKLDGPFAFLQTAPSSSDISVWQFLAPILTGGRCVVVDETNLLDPRQLFALIMESGVAIVELVPVLMKLLVDHAAGLSADKKTLPDLKWMMVTGESAPAGLVNEWLALYPQIKVVNAYGPTEAADDVIQAIIDQPLPQEQRSVPIGRPLANLRIYIVNEQMQLMPIGVPGEICVAGIGVGVGYWKDEEKTRASFVPDPFDEGTGGLIYKTGDLGKWLPDGSIDFIGRRDGQVKVRGFRVELGEIEAVLRQHPGVKEGVVLVTEGDPESRKLLAYVVPNSQELDPKDLREFLKKSLPAHMVPSAFIVLDSLPLTPNGKIDRKALPPADSAALADAGDRADAPGDTFELHLTMLWEELLGRSGIGVQDNFFEIGGHSLLATQLMSRIERAFGQVLPLRALFQAPTIAGLADLLRRQVEPASWPTMVPLRTSGSASPLFFIVRPNANPLGYVYLSRYLDKNHPIYVLQSTFRTEEDGAYTQQEFAELATEYVQLIRGIQPHGPYLLGGNCEGALIAFEMSRQLQEQNERTALLAIIDAWPLENTRSYIRWRLHTIGKNWHSFWRKGLAKIARSLSKSVLRLGRRFGSLFRGKRTATSKSTRIIDSFKDRYWPSKEFVPPTITAKITLFRVKKQKWWRIKDPEMGWGAWTTDKVVVHIVPGEHNTLLREPDTQLLAQRLNECLARACAPPAPNCPV